MDEDQLYRERSTFLGNCANGFEQAAGAFESRLCERIPEELRKKQGSKEPPEIIRETIHFQVTYLMSLEAIVAYISLNRLWTSFPNLPYRYELPEQIDSYLSAVVVDHLYGELLPRFYNPPAPRFRKGA